MFRLSVDTDDPASGVVHIAKPIGMALMGNGLEEEVELVVDGQARTVIIEKVMKAA
jgi:transcription elongation GreA/GreB family factor